MLHRLQTAGAKAWRGAHQLGTDQDSVLDAARNIAKTTPNGLSSLMLLPDPPTPSR